MKNLIQGAKVFGDVRIVHHTTGARKCTVENVGGAELPVEIDGVDNQETKYLPLRAEYFEKRGGNLYGDAPEGTRRKTIFSKDVTNILLST